MALRDIDKFIVVMLENRSFDHACGYLSLPASNRLDIEGLKDDEAWRNGFANDDHDGTPRKIHLLEPSVQNITDPPHEDVNIHTQINTPTHANASSTMGGFVKSYWDASPRPPDRSLVMGYYDERAVPVFDFFARNFAICDHWFSPLPAGTQTNRLMAMSGESQIHQNVSDPLKFPDQHLVYDWVNDVLGENHWCSYQWDGLPFFSMMARWLPVIMADRNDPSGLGAFRKYEQFGSQWQAEAPVPEVVFIEPKYTDDPTFSFRHSNDDHCPTGITAGQKFLADIYNTIIQNDNLWKSTMLIVTYDEHGGFFDHVTPPAIPAQAGGVNFATTGVRVPAFIISPYVKPGSVFSEIVDTTSILRLLADRFTPGTPYSAAVAARQKNFSPLSTVLNNPPVATQPQPIPPVLLDGLLFGTPAAGLDTGASTPTATALGRASSTMAALHPNTLLRSRTAQA
jgi:phospholipase C